MSPFAVSAQTAASGSQARTVVRALRPAQWLKSGLVFAGLIFGGKLLDPSAVASAIAAAICFSALSSGFYLINDIRDADADRLHPVKRFRPVASGDLPASTAGALGIVLIVFALAGSVFLGFGFLLVLLAYTGLMATYNLALKHIVIVDVFVIAAGFVLRAAGGAIAVDVSISPWLLVCTVLLALLVGFGKRRYEVTSLPDAVGHRRNLETYSPGMLDQAVAVTAAGTLIAYAVYTFDGDSVPQDHAMMLTIPIVAYGVFRYLYLLYDRGQGGSPETMLFTDRALLCAVVLWTFSSTLIFYLGN